MNPKELLKTMILSLKILLHSIAVRNLVPSFAFPILIIWFFSYIFVHSYVEREYGTPFSSCLLTSLSRFSRNHSRNSETPRVKGALHQPPFIRRTEEAASFSQSGQHERGMKFLRPKTSVSYIGGTRPRSKPSSTVVLASECDDEIDSLFSRAA